MGTPSAIDVRARGPRLYHVQQDHPLAIALLAELAIDYSTRYGDTAGAIHHRLRDCPAADFADPLGDLVVLVEHGEPVAGGGFRRRDPTTAELERVWTAREQRRRGLATRVLAELEAGMIRLGYRQACAAIGDRQPEARRLYTTAGYTEVRSGPQRRDRPFRFEKVLGADPLVRGGTPEGAAIPIPGRVRRRV
ncbi:GNAT family N-acetyltransferase [Nocardia sp. NBC_00416]|uniref:GNAT family N-acetyltransferase n=1 Tax=Nocardia sp. NBC_00416 TaxID=2975991 RepID=UPI002E21FF6B